jgi:DNA polymerase-3 subunit gamma/tau
MPLHLDYRPKVLDELYGNESLKASLKSILDRKDRPRAYMFTGPSGCGKTTLARIVAEAYGCVMDMDYSELNIANIGGKDEGGRIQKEMHYSPMSGPVKVYCLDECQDSSSQFQASILKALEDTPKHVLFILCTTDPQRLKKTIHTRCSRFEVRPLDPATMQSFLLDVLKKEGMEDYPGEPVAGIIQAAEGSPRQALIILDQIIDLPDTASVMAAIGRFTVAETQVLAFCQGLLAKDWGRCKAQLQAMDAKANLEGMRQAVLTYMRKVLLGDRPNGQAYFVIRAFEKPFYDSGLAGIAAAAWGSIALAGKDISF